MINFSAILPSALVNRRDSARDRDLQALLASEPDRLYGRWDGRDYERNLMVLQARIGQQAARDLQTLGDHRWRWSWQAWLIPAVALITLVVSFPGMQQRLRFEAGGFDQGDRLKGDPASVAVAPAPLHLKFALLNKDSSGGGEPLLPGYNGMKVALGETIVFAVETAVPSEATRINIAYAMLPELPQHLVEDYLLPARTGSPQTDSSRALELVQGEDGFLAFTPEEKGTYVFQITTQDQADTGLTHGGFAIEVVSKKP